LRDDGSATGEPRGFRRLEALETVPIVNTIELPVHDTRLDPQASDAGFIVKEFDLLWCGAVRPRRKHFGVLCPPARGIA